MNQNQQLFNLQNFDYFNCRNRLATFRDRWPYDKLKRAKCTSTKMAKAGFFCTTSPDEQPSGKCYICQRELIWEQHDDPQSEHLANAPECPLNGLKKKQEGQYTVGDYLKLLAFCHASKNHTTADEMIDNFKSLTRRLLTTSRMGAIPK